MYKIGRVELSAIGELQRKFNGFVTRVRTSVLKTAVAKAIEPIRDTAEHLLVVERIQAEPRHGISGGQGGNPPLEHLATNIKAKVKVYTKPNYTVAVGIVGAAGAKKAPHAHLVEWGTTHRYTKKGQYRGVMPRLPFMALAWKANKHTFLRILEQEFTAGIEREAAKL